MTYAPDFWSNFFVPLNMTSVHLYIPSPTARGGLTATELLNARMPCFHRPQDFLTSFISPSLYQKVISS